MTGTEIREESNTIDFFHAFTAQERRRQLTAMGGPLTQ